MQSAFSWMKNLSEREKTDLSPQISTLPSFLSFSFLHHFRHRFGAACQAGILSAASRAGMDDVEQLKNIIPIVACEITFGQNVCE